jgi:broad specificity phosphatase PhoE
MKPATIYIFRHGETDWNVQRRFQGHTDISLNENGRRQAKVLAGELKQHQVQVILSSDLSRALETAKIASYDLHIPIEISKSLREAQLGKPEGELRDDIVKIYGEESWQRWLSVKPEDMEFCFPEGETKRAHLNRIKHYLESYLLDHPDVERVGVSTHGGSLRRMVHFCEGSPSDPIPIPNCSMFKLEFNRDKKTWKFLGVVAANEAPEKLFS